MVFVSDCLHRLRLPLLYRPPRAPVYASSSDVVNEIVGDDKVDVR